MSAFAGLPLAGGNGMAKTTDGNPSSLLMTAASLGVNESVLALRSRNSGGRSSSRYVGAAVSNEGRGSENGSPLAVAEYDGWLGRGGSSGTALKEADFSELA